MKNLKTVVLFFLAGLIWLSVPSCVQSREPAQIRAMSFNIRYDNPDDGDNAWESRRDRVTITLEFHAVDVCGLQEVLHNQLLDLTERLPGYEWIGVGRDDGAQKGEYAPIFFRTDRVRLLDSGFFWLSETPEIAGSFGWDAACTRIVTWGKFEHRATGKVFFVFNTHFDHIGQTAREQSAILLKERIAAKASGLPVILTGDFNCTKDNRAYLLLTSGSDGEAKIQDTHQLSQNPHYGGAQTFNGFQREIRPGNIIDFVFVRNTGPVLRHAIIAEKWDGRFASDHYPVVADISI